MTITHKQQSGMMLLEALIGILIFSIGILALVAMQARSVSTLADAQYRVEAVNLANRLLSQIWVNANRSNDTTLNDSLTAFQHQAGGAQCDFDGAVADTAKSQGKVADAWVTMVRQLLPGANDPRYQQVRVERMTLDPVKPTYSFRVTITVCWAAPNEPAGSEPHRHTVVAYVN
jgi:type IV pilus assembly protein PilV